MHICNRRLLAGVYLQQEDSGFFMGFKIVSGDAVHQPTWPLLLKIEHVVKLQVFGNNSKTLIISKI